MSNSELYVAIQFLIIGFLSMMVVFRRKMSCNRVYVVVDEDEHHQHEEDSKSMKQYLEVRRTMAKKKKHIMERTENRRKSSFASSDDDHEDGDDGGGLVPSDEISVSHQEHQEHQNKMLALPEDVQIHILSFLHPKHVLTMSSVCRHSRRIVDGDSSYYSSFKNRKNDHDSSSATSTSDLLWLKLWNRDYGWVLKEWSVGCEALERSRRSILLHKNENKEKLYLRCPPIVAASLNFTSMEAHYENEDTASTTNNKNNNDGKIPSVKEWYFTFSQTWMNYAIAGHATTESCLTGVHGHVFDITNFLEDHPGSPESLLMHGGGKDSSNIFESVGHSLKARRMARYKYLVAIDKGYSSFDFRRRKNSGIVDTDVFGDDFLLSNMSTLDCGVVGVKVSKQGNSDDKNIHVDGGLVRNRKKFRTFSYLSVVGRRLQSEEQVEKKKANLKIMKEMTERCDINMLGGVNVYFDPFTHSWKGWYLDLDFCVVFMHKL